MSIEPSPRFPEERRLATVLFADVQGFTSLAEKLDFETVSDMLKGIWNRLDRVVEAHNGYIDKHLGDGLMAVWGAPFAGDNDAEQAVAAGLELIRALHDFCQTTSISGVAEMKLRVGVNSGLVFAGYVGTRREYTVLGDTVNLAARLEQVAEPDSVVIGENTLRLVGGSFRVRRLPPTLVKGKTEPVQPYAVESAALQIGRIRYQSADSLQTCMVGREAEMERLCSLFDEVERGRLPLMALLDAELGMGKSRLLLELGNRLAAPPQNITLLTARALAQTSRIPFYLWRALLRNRFGLRDEDHREVALQKWQGGLDNLYREEPVNTRTEVGNALQAMMGLAEQESSPSPEASRRVNFLTAEVLRRLADNRPLAIFLDDLQWADRESLNLLTYLLQAGDKALPLFVVAAARPEFLKSQPQWHNLARVLHLEPLAFSASLVARAYPDLQPWPAASLEEIGSRSEGNPYFLEEIVKSLLKSETGAAGTGTLRPDWAVAIPESLRATLQARLDSLSREARTVALLASVVGRVFWVGSLLAAARSAPLPGGAGGLNIPPMVAERFVQDGLRQLVRAELAFPRAGSQFSEEQEYIFKSSYLRDVAYSLLPNRVRAQVHHAVAEWLSQRRDPAYLSMARDHEESAAQAARLSTGSLPPL